MVSHEISCVREKWEKLEGVELLGICFVDEKDQRESGDIGGVVFLAGCQVTRPEVEDARLKPFLPSRPPSLAGWI